MKIWWCGWDAPDDVPDEHCVETWPDGMKGWITGYGEDYTTYAGSVTAPTAKAAMKIVCQCYGASGHRIAERWEPYEHDGKLGSRFQNPSA